MKQKRRLTEWLRLATLLLEYFIIFIVLMIFSFPALNNDSFGLFRITHESYKLETLADPLIYISLAGFALLFCKDCFNGQSLTKRIIKLQVVDNKTGSVATPMQCFIRNTTLVLLPLECLIALIRPDRRIGDKIAGTKLVIYDADTKVSLYPTFKKYILPFTLAYIMSVALAYGLSKITFNKPKTKFVATSLNQTESNVLDKLMTENFSQYYSVSVKCYDSIENHHLKYVSVICFFKESFFNKIAETDQIRTQTTEKLYSLFPKELINGRLQYVYKSGGSMTSWEEPIGISIKENDE